MAATADQEAWTTSGSVRTSLQAGCGSSPTCLAFLAAARLDDGCQQATTIQDGVEISIMELPDEAPGTSALFRWSSTAEILGSMTVGWIGELNGVCRDLGSISLMPYGDLSFFGYGTGVVSVEPRARFVYVGAERGADIRWHLSPRAS